MSSPNIQRRLSAIRARIDHGIDLDRTDVRLLMDLVECGLNHLHLRDLRESSEDKELEAQAASGR